MNKRDRTPYLEKPGDPHNADLNFRKLSIKVARAQALTEQFYTMHLCFDTASAVVSGDLPPQCATKVL
jgi:hypothetical protein